MPIQQQPLQNACSPSPGYNRATAKRGYECSLCVAHAGATPNPPSTSQLAASVAPVAPVAPAQGMNEFMQRTAELLGRAPKSHDAHVSAWGEYIERAAIIEYVGGDTRARAEALSLRLIINRQIRP